MRDRKIKDGSRANMGKRVMRYANRNQLVEDVARMGAEGWVLERLTRLIDQGYEVEFVDGSMFQQESTVNSPFTS